MNQALFLDRDGIFNEVVFRNGKMHSPHTFSEVIHYPGLEGLSRFKEAGFLLIMVTNQPDLERKLLTQEFLDKLHGDYQKKYSLDAVYCCPFASESHPDKKPNPGMFLKAIADWNIDAGKSYHLGDTDRDVEAAKRAGIQSVLWDREYNREIRSDYRIKNLQELEGILSLRMER